MAVELIEKSGAQIAQEVRSSNVSATEITEATLAHIEAVDGVFGAYLTVLGDLARAFAARVDERLRRGERPALAGVPIAVKDNMCLEGTRTTCGSKIFGAMDRALYCDCRSSNDRSRGDSSRQNKLR